MSKPRAEYLDIAKGIGILLVVWAHGGGPFTKEIYAFHMPLFFLISGYLYNQKVTWHDFLKKKFFSLYVPFLLCNGVFIVFDYITGLERLPAAKELNKVIKIALTLSKEGIFLGATWFLGALFAVSVIYKIADTMLEKYRYRRWMMTLLFAAFAYIAFRYTLMAKLSRTVILGGFFAVGVWVKEYGSRIIQRVKHWPVMDAVLGIGAGVFFCVLVRDNVTSMGRNNYSAGFIEFVVCALCGSYAVIYCSKLIAAGTRINGVKKLLVFLGRRSMDILLWQFVAFRFVSFVQMKYNGVTFAGIDWMKDYDAWHYGEGYWWIAYLLVGIIGPLLIGAALKKIKDCTKG